MPELDPSIAHLDWPVCQCESEACNGQCANEATLRTEFHALDHCNSIEEELTGEGNRVLALCVPCYESLRTVIASYVIALGRFGRPHCIGCGAPVRCVKDVIREAKKL